MQPARSRSFLAAAVVVAAVIWPALGGHGSLRAQGAAGKHVLVLYSHESTSYADLERPLRASLTRDLRYPVDFYTEYLDLIRFPRERHEQEIVGSLQAKYRGRHLDLIVVVGSLAFDFLVARRDELFEGAPILFVSVNAERFRSEPLPPNTTGVSVRRDYKDTLDLALQIHPDTLHVFIPVGCSTMEKEWLEALKDSFKSYAGRVEVTYLTDLPMHEIVRRVQNLPPRSLILFAPMLYTDSAGNYFRPEDLAGPLATSANAPVYGTDEPFLGSGIVGGVLYDLASVGVTAGALGRRILAGEQAAHIPVETMDPNRAAFDARQLQRWGIDERRLPAGSAVLFRQPTLWTQYRTAVITTVALLAGQTVIVSLLLVQRARRRRAEVALRASEQGFRSMAERNQDLAGRLIGAQENERARIARDLHDDLSQQLATIGLMLSALEHAVSTPDGEAEVVDALTTLRLCTLSVAESVRNLSHELHPDALVHAGLVGTLRRHCVEVAERNHLSVTFNAGDGLDALGPEITLCLFRVAQEALNNAVRHGRPRRIDVQLMAANQHAELRIVDDGAGFVVSESRGSGLGLRSIDERVRLMRGTMCVESMPGQGTTLRVEIPRERLSPLLEAE